MARTSRRKILLQKPEVSSQNHFTALWTEEEALFIYGNTLELTKPARSTPHVTTKHN